MSNNNTHQPPEDFTQTLTDMGFGKIQVRDLYAKLERVCAALSDEGIEQTPLQAAMETKSRHGLNGLLRLANERQAEQIAFEMLGCVESHISILYNYMRNELMAFDSWQTLKPDAELCKTLGLETNTKAGWLTLLIKPALVELKRKVIENSKDRLRPKFAFQELVFQICDSQDSGTLKAIQKVIFDDHLLYTAEEMAILDKVFQTRKKKSLLTS